MKTPSFWYQSSSLWQTLLSPLSAIYQTAQTISSAHRNRQSAPIPVISIGNVTAGGSGKTPVAIAIAHLLRQHNLFMNPFFVTRGYGGTIKKPELISEKTSPSLSGDEAQILCRHAKTIVARNRYEGAVYAHDVGADIVILDDGLQNRYVNPNLSFCVVDGIYGFGNEQLIPAGPLREPIAQAISRIHAMIRIGPDRANIAKHLPSTLPVFSARFEADTSHINLTSSPYIAFCGLGLPQKFYQTLSDLHANIISTHDFADHVHYKYEDIDHLVRLAQKHSVRLITTEKDFVKIKHVYDDVSLIDVLPVSIKFDDDQKVIEFIQGALPLT